MIIEYDEKGKVIPNGDFGYYAERNHLEVEILPEGDFPISYIGEIYFDELHKCIIDNREVNYWYEVHNNELVKIGWPERFARGEFSLEQFREKVLVFLKRNYQRDVSITDADYFMYNKRLVSGMLEDGDEEKYLNALSIYKQLTYKYRQDRTVVTTSNTIEELSLYFNSH